MHIGLVADGKAVPDLERLARCAEDELRELLALMPADQSARLSEGVRL